MNEALRRMARSALDSLGRYEDLELIGEGGMGKVYRARQLNPRRTVALKVLRSPLATETDVLRFERECQILGQLNHRGIARIYDAGMESVRFGEQPFFAMELVDGISLPRYLDRENPDLHARLSLFLEICDAVHHAHSKGIIHRDLKPANILVQPDGQPKIIDFGVARVLGLDTGINSLRTQAGQVLGTPQYMSPEQARGEVELVDAQSDVYSLGLLLHELLAGRAPYKVDGESSLEVIRIICDEPLARPSTLRPELRGDLEAIILKALDRDRDHRYASALHLSRDLKRFLHHETVLARPPSAWRRFSLWSRRHPTRSVLLLLMMLAMLVASGVGTSRAVEIWHTARTAGERWEEGDLMGARQALGELPMWTDGFLLPTSLQPCAEDLRELTGAKPCVAVAREQDRRGAAEAWLLAARHAEADGLGADPILARFLARALDTPPDERPPHRSDALAIVARLFFDRPNGSPAEREASSRIRARLHAVAREPLPHRERLYVYTALSGAGDAESVRTILRLVQKGLANGSSAHRREELRLGMRAVETIVLRSHACGYVAEPTAEEYEEIQRFFGERVAEFVAGDEWHRHWDVLEQLTVAVDVARRAAGYPPCEYDPGFPPANAWMVRAVRGDASTRDVLLHDPAVFLDARSRHPWGTFTVQCYSSVLETAGLRDPNGDVQEQVLKLAVERGLDREEAAQAFLTGAQRARDMVQGIRLDWIPDEDTHLGAWFAQENLEATPYPLEVTAIEGGTAVARWVFRRDGVHVAGNGTQISTRGVFLDVGASNGPRDYVKLGVPGISELRLGFECFAANDQVLRVQVSAVKALRGLLPYNGECHLVVLIDDEPLGEHRLETSNVTVFEIPTLWSRFGSGPHVLTIRLAPRSNTTVRITAVTVLN